MCFFNKKLLLILLLVHSWSKTDELMLGCWLPYWKNSEAIAAAREKLYCFDQVSPFAYEVGAGKLIDKFKRHDDRWQDFFKVCRERAIKIIPTIFWTNSKAMHDCLSHKEKRADHVKNIISKIVEEKFNGININYERVQACDREFFLSFMQELSAALREKQLHLCCSMGGRTGDTSIGVVKNQVFTVPEAAPSPPHIAIPHIAVPGVKKHTATVSLYPGRGADAQRYKKILTSCCDQIHIMGYDEWGIPCRNNKTNFENQYYISHASNQWIEQIIRYALSYVQPDKLILAIPTYGLEFIIYPQKGKHDIRFKKARNVTYPVAIELAKQHNKTPSRTAGGELAFTYKKNNDLHYVCFLDGQAIKDKIAIAKKYNLKGVYIFKIDGAEDKNMWSCVDQELHEKQKLL